MEWMLKPLRQYADFQGRARRKEYWMFQLFQIIVCAVLALLAAIGATMGEPGHPSVLFIAAIVLLCMVGLAFVVPNIAVSVRRFHDQDKSGWFYLLGFVPMVGGLIVLVFMCMEGTQGSNQFGADPKQDRATV